MFSLLFMGKKGKFSSDNLSLFSLRKAIAVTELLY